MHKYFCFFPPLPFNNYIVQKDQKYCIDCAVWRKVVLDVHAGRERYQVVFSNGRRIDFWCIVTDPNTRPQIPRLVEVSTIRKGQTNFTTLALPQHCAVLLRATFVAWWMRERVRHIILHLCLWVSLSESRPSTGTNSLKIQQWIQLQITLLYYQMSTVIPRKYTDSTFRIKTRRSSS